MALSDERAGVPTFDYTPEAIGRLLAAAETAREYIDPGLDARVVSVEKAAHDLAALDVAIREVKFPTPALRMNDALQRLGPRVHEVGLDNEDLDAMRTVLNIAAAAEQGVA